MAKRKFENYRSPKGVAFFPALTTPNTHFNPQGDWKTGLIVDPENEEVAEFLQRLRDIEEEHWKAVVKEAKTPAKKKRLKRNNLPFTEHLDTDDNETGEILINFKSPASTTNKETGKTTNRTVAKFDSKGKPLPLDTEIWGGSTLKVAGFISPYHTPKSEVGISLKLQAVQVIDLVGPNASTDATKYGFGEEEGGYEYVKPETSDDDDGLGEAEEEDEGENDGNW